MLRVLPELERAAAAWGQQALVRELPFYLSVPGRLPVLVLLNADGAAPCEVQGAVFLHAYASAVFGKRLLSSADRLGRVGVFGPAAQRVEIGVEATRALLQTGSALVRLPFVSEADPSAERSAQAWSQELGLCKPNPSAEDWELQSRDLFFDLTLHPDLDGTLAQLGRRTRRNIREVMRRSVADLQCRFISAVSMTLEEFLKTNRCSARPLSSRVARWRYRQTHAPSAFFCGIQTGEGRWLGLAGGHISAKTLILTWQMNDLDFARYSPSLLMRALLMQHFGAQGLQFVYFEGGTAHRIAGHFNKRRVYVLRARRRSAWLHLLQACMKRWLPTKSMTRVLFGYG